MASRYRGGDAFTVAPTEWDLSVGFHRFFGILMSFFRFGILLHLFRFPTHPHGYQVVKVLQ